MRFEYPDGGEDLDVILKDPEILGRLGAGEVEELRDGIKAETERSEMGIRGWLKYFDVSPASVRAAFFLHVVYTARESYNTFES